MRMLAVSLLLLSFSGCCSGPNWSKCDRHGRGPLACSESCASAPASATPSSPLKPLDDPLVPPSPSEARRRSAPHRGLVTSSDESLRKLTTELERAKRDKSQLETKLTEETAKQTQQRLELEARLVVLQQQLQLTQANAVRQVQYRPVQSVVASESDWTNNGFGRAPATWNPSSNPWNGSDNGVNLPRTSPVETWPFSPQR